MRDSLRLKSWQNFLLPLLSISSQTWVVLSSAIPGSSVLSDWLLLVFLGVCLETVANFPSFPNVALILRERPVSCEDSIEF